MIIIYVHINTCANTFFLADKNTMKLYSRLDSLDSDNSFRYTLYRIKIVCYAISLILKDIKIINYNYIFNYKHLLNN